jgi:LacI family transcriptional regulator
LQITIKDIAKEAHVSFATVSRAFNGVYGVRPATRKRILEIAERLNYTPNGIARGLVRKQTKTIGLILPDITNPFYPEVARGIEEGAKKDGYSVFLCNTNWEQQRQSQYIQILAEKRVDGIIIAPVADATDPLLDRLFDTIPVVYVDRPPQNTRRSYVVIDNVRGGFIATEHLIEAGYRAIGFVGGVEQSMPVDERLKGFRMAMERHGLPIEDRFIKIGHFRQETGISYIEELIRQGSYPRAVFAENDIVALGVIQGVRQMGLSVPEDVAVIGFDDIPIASFGYIQLSTVLQPKYEMGVAAVRILIEHIQARAAERRPSPRSSRRGGGSDDRGAAAARGGSGESPESTADPRGGASEGFDRRQVVILEPELIVRKSSR